MRILLDTHVLWRLAYEPDKLSDHAREAIRGQEANALAISSATIYELAWLLERQRLTVSVGAEVFLREVQSRFLVLPIDGAIAVRAAQLASPFHGDPMDRLIVATAIASDRTLVSADQTIRASGLCPVVW